MRKYLHCFSAVKPEAARANTFYVARRPESRHDGESSYPVTATGRESRAAAALGVRLESDRNQASPLKLEHGISSKPAKRIHRVDRRPPRYPQKHTPAATDRCIWSSEGV